jgi:hypothetical protein
LSAEKTVKKWRVLKNELKLAKNTEEINIIKVNGEDITDNTEIALKVKQHFETCATKLAEGITGNEEY